MMSRAARPYAALVASAVLLASTSGCYWVTTKREGERLRADVTSLESRVAEREEDLEGKIQQLERVLAEATQVLQRNSADLGADVESMREELRTMQGLVAEGGRLAEEVRAEVTTLKESFDKERAALEERLAALAALEERVAALESRAAQPQSPEELYAAAKAAFDSADHGKARTLFRQLVVRFPGHERADDSQYYRGESYYREKDYAGAIRELQLVFDKFPSSPLADDALFRAGEAAQNLRRCSEARAYFGLLRQKYSSSALAKKALAKDKELKRDLKNKKKCTS